MFRFKRRDDAKYNLFRDLAIIVFSIAIGVMLIKTDVLANLFVSTRGMAIVGSFISGIFFVSIFTTVPATIALGEIARVNSLFVVALVGALGSVAGDMLIFRFVKNDISEDFVYLLKKTGAKRLLAIFQRRLFHWLLALLGALVIISPLPDELAMSMMGLAKVRTSYLIALSLTLNFLGILIVGLIARAL